MIADGDIHRHYARSGHNLTIRHEIKHDLNICKLIIYKYNCHY